MSLALIVFAVALAQNGPPPPDLVHPTEMDAYVAWRNAIEKAQAVRELAAGCQAITALGGHSVGTVTDLGKQFQAEEFEGPAFKEVYLAQSCADKVRHNILVLRYKVGGWRASKLMAGETLLGPEMVPSVMKAAFGVAAQKEPRLSCTQEEMLKTYKVTDTKVVSENFSGGGNGEWVERWTQTPCG
ncbi:hypothetical protein [Caulobacter sp. S45]|uniref:hypothetical protein n=1 Tax=Caulobacter sp. S45 TaxID=1641861 RepID=UPI00131D9E98|nr:hypothetical protein [Caulobacter sp. S45]